MPGKIRHCPRCGFEEPAGQKVNAKIWMSREIEKVWEAHASGFDTKELAFIDLLTKAKLYSMEKPRISVETAGRISRG